VRNSDLPACHRCYIVFIQIYLLIFTLAGIDNVNLDGKEVEEESGSTAGSGGGFIVNSYGTPLHIFPS